jgi:hypothetical protein
LLRSPRTYDPSDYEDEIKLVFMTSLGRGRGFKTIGEETLAEDTELYSTITDRLDLLHQAHCSKKSPNKLLDTKEELTDELDQIQVEVDKRDKAMLQKVNNVLIELGYDEHTSLDEAVDLLIGEYLDLLEEGEDEFN